MPHLRHRMATDLVGWRPRDLVGWRPRDLVGWRPRDLVGWEAAGLVAGGRGLVLGSCRLREAAGSCRLEAAGSCRLEAAGSCRLEAAGSCWLEAAGSCRLEAAGSCRLEAAGTLSAGGRGILSAGGRGILSTARRGLWAMDLVHVPMIPLIWDRVPRFSPLMARNAASPGEAIPPVPWCRPPGMPCWRHERAKPGRTPGQQRPGSWPGRADLHPYRGSDYLRHASLGSWWERILGILGLAFVLVTLTNIILRNL